MLQLLSHTQFDFACSSGRNPNIPSVPINYTHCWIASEVSCVMQAVYIHQCMRSVFGPAYNNMVCLVLIFLLQDVRKAKLNRKMLENSAVNAITIITLSS